GLHPPSAQEDRERADPHRHRARAGLLPGESVTTPPPVVERAPREAPPPAERRTNPMSFGLFQREQRSLFGEILDWMLTPLLLLWPLSLALTWIVAQGIANKPFDRALEFNLQALSQLVVVRDGEARLVLDSQARDLLRADDTDIVYYQLVNA